MSERKRGNNCVGCKYYQTDPFVLGDCSNWNNGESICSRGIHPKLADHYEPIDPPKPTGGMGESKYKEYIAGEDLGKGDLIFLNSGFAWRAYNPADPPKSKLPYPLVLGPLFKDKASDIGMVLAEKLNEVIDCVRWLMEVKE